jgi:hypothetical protein
MITGMLCLEVIVRVFHLTITEKLTADVNGDKLMNPGTKGIAVHGGLGEVKGRFSINAQGWNSIKDYGELPENKIKIAIIGDSYVQGFHANVEESIGRILEKQMNDSVCVHEFGIVGGNIIDYGVLFEKFIKGKYDYTFIRLAKDDLIGNDTRFMGKGNTIPKETTSDKFLSNFLSIQYLKATYKVDIVFTQMLVKIYNGTLGMFGTKKGGQKIIRTNPITPASDSALLKFDSSAIFFYEKKSLDSNIIKRLPIPCMEIIHRLQPIDHGFDRHWNMNGRVNCATNFRDYIHRKESQKTFR